MFSHYYEVREGLSSSRTNTPQPEVLREEIFTSNQVKARSAVEYRAAFVADIDNYLKRLDWYDCEVMLGRMPEPGCKQVAWRKLSKVIKADIRTCPRNLSDHSNLAKRYYKSLVPDAERYFRDRGYLW
jgi:hypothetical protein